MIGKFIYVYRIIPNPLLSGKSHAALHNFPLESKKKKKKGIWIETKNVLLSSNPSCYYYFFQYNVPHWFFGDDEVGLAIVGEE